MSLDDVKEVAAKLGMRRLERSTSLARPLDYVIVKGRMNLWLGFKDGRLETLQAAEGYGLKGYRMFQLENLCTGEITGFARLSIRAPAELADAAITLDGEGGYRLPQEALKGWLRRDVGNIASGKHEVAIEKPGYDPIRLHFTTGVERRALEITIDASEVRRTKAQ